MKRLLIALVALVVVNIASAFLFFRADLTAEKRYTLSTATRNLLANLDDDIHINVYLTGDLPPSFKRLENAVRETLDEFAARADRPVTYRFVDVDAVTDSAARKKLVIDLMQKGLTPTNVVSPQGGKRTEKIAFPWAVVSYKGQEVPVLLLKGNKAASPEEQLNQSYEGVEYALASAVRKLTQPAGSRRRVGLLARTKVPPSRFSDLLASVQENYDLFFVDLSKPGPLTNLDVLLVPKPDQPFSDDDLFKIDQYVVKGGHALFFVDGARVDSVGVEGTFAQPLALNLDELFFGWGVRVNRDLVKDLSCNVIPLNVGSMGDKPNIQLVPWRFYPIINNFGAQGAARNPIVRNLDAVWARFASTIDTVRAQGAGGSAIRKTPLLLTSPYTQLRQAPVVLAYNEARQQPDPRTYNGGVRVLACLLEGRFRSLYANQILPGDPRAQGFKAEGDDGSSERARVIVCSDGDLVVNDVDYKRQTPYPLGFDRYTRQTFANKDFALNAIDYLADPEGVIEARNRQITLRPLDKIRLRSERTSWQLLNLLGPVMLVGLIGLIWQWNRRRQYGQ
ncbi:MAG: gliding motility-associated ABC transporter substrate-binding protein GldG [Cytophagales bacterium]|nr:MAG: gliding motility-associated ABC transporter substrate-binding protein GldG [Cytophagales bacterium]